MLLKPDETPDMVQNEIRRVTLNLSGAVGINTITDCDVTCPSLTIGTPSINGTDITFLVTASNIGTHYILASATLSSSETVKGYIRAKVLGTPTDDGLCDRYDD